MQRGETPLPEETITTSAWLSGLRSKFTSNMAEWLKNSLGLGAHNKETPSDTKSESSTECDSQDEDGVDQTKLSPVTEGDAPGQESWELANLWDQQDPTSSNKHDTMEMQHFGPLRGLVPTGKKELGAGHEFYVVQLRNPTWCDKCGDFIWGFYKQAVRCSTCNYTCHYKCRMLVTLDCRSLSDSSKSASTIDTDLLYATARSAVYPLSETSSELSDGFTEITSLGEDVNDVEVQVENDELDDDWLFSLPPPKELKSLVDIYNAEAEGLGMVLDENCLSFSGYAHIHMNFTRPINIVVGQTPPSVYNVTNPEDTLVPSDLLGTGNVHKTITSFFLPRNTVKILHLTSETTTREMIVNLLRKFKVADNPRKFALYERHFVMGQTLVAKLVRISEDAYPLRLALQWGHNSGKRFVLQENDTGDIAWDAFEVPELNNFLKILALEEEQYVWQIRQRFQLYRHYLELEMRERGIKPREKVNSTTRPSCSPPPPPPPHQTLGPPIPSNGMNNDSTTHNKMIDEPIWVKQDNFNTMSTADSIKRSAENTLNSGGWDYYSGTL